MLKSQSQHNIPSSSFQFKPRQVLLLQSKNISMKNSKKNASSSFSETEKPERKTLLNLFIAHYLSKYGFVKSLSKFRSEAKLDEFDCSKEYSLHTEEELLKCLESMNQAHGHSDGDKEQERQINGISRKVEGSNCISSLETDIKEKKKKSKSDKKDTSAAENESEAIKKVISSVIPNDIVTSDLVLEPIVKSKTKRKKLVNGSEEAIHVSSDVLTTHSNGTVNEPLVDNSCKKNKEKKKSKSGCESLDENANDNETEVHVNDAKKKKEKIVESKSKKLKDYSALKSFPKKEIEIDEKTNTEIKESKKRKRMSSEVQDCEPTDEISNEESKRRKTRSMEESQPKKHLTEVNAVIGSDGLVNKESKEEDKVSFNNSQDKSVKQKSLKKQNAGSVEPKSANAFQRVKIDKVVFTDERLQDNSYWAKGGAEIGYGAKAQEVLGQVRGRDFRHEKTKKKRGSYRGGQIDFTSHSVKFNYSDDE